MPQDPEAAPQMPEIPDDLAGLSDDELNAIAEQASAAFDAIRTGDLTEDAIGTLAAVAEAIERISVELAGRNEVRAGLQEKADELARRIDAARSPEPEPDAEPVVEAEPQLEPVLAAAPVPATIPATPARRPNLNEIRAKQKVVEVHESPVTITAAADVPGVPMGSRFDDRAAIATAFHSRARNLPVSQGNGIEAPVAIFTNPYGNLPIARMDNQGSIDEALRKARDPEVLVAAGGWCAPSETVYNLYDISCTDSMIDLPTVTIDRGGIRFAKSPSLADAVGAVWDWTEQNDIDAATPGGPTKPCLRIPCPTFTEVRLACTGVCITAGNLASAAYPEMTSLFVSLALAAHQKRINASVISQMVAGSTNVAFPAEAGGAIAPLLGALDLSAAAYRAEHGMCCGDILEVVLPCWAAGALRSDYAKRACTDMGNVSDADISGWLNDRNLRAQYVADWQAIPVNATTWPANIEALMYPAGAWVRGTGFSLSLGVIRDSTLNATNDHTAIFSEECWLVFQPGFESKHITVPVCPDGSTALGVDFACSAA